jgi:hypothetical protein
MDEVLMKRYPWMDALMVQTLIKLEEEGKLQPLLESMSNDPHPIWNVTSDDIIGEKNNEGHEETPVEER